MRKKNTARKISLKKLVIVALSNQASGKLKGGDGGMIYSVTKPVSALCSTTPIC